MTKKQLVLILVALVALIAYARYFTDWFTPNNIQIVHTLRPPMQKRRNPTPDNQDVNVVSFGFNGKFKLTEIKVVASSDLATNKYAHALWHLVTESNSPPTKGITYGMPVNGMHPKTSGVRPEPLEPGVSYHLFLTAGDIKGEYDFKTSESSITRR